MNRSLLAAFLGALVLMAGACKSKTDNKDAIREGVVKHIAGMNGLNVNNMSIVVTQATVNGDKAEANVEIRAKNAEPGAPPMQLVYQMQKQGEEWVVVKGQSTGGMQHPAAGEMPQGGLPPGHPSTGGASGQMPANHPDFNAILNSAQPPAQTQQQPPATTQQPQKSPGGTSKP